MPIRYYPLNRVLTNQKTNGGEFSLNGRNYSGYYYKTYDGKVFTGKDPVQGPSLPLTPISLSANTSTGQTYKTPVPYYPKPNDTDYKRGSIMRYFVKKRGQPGFVIEVDKATHDSLQNVDSVYDYVTYETISTFWQITGPRQDTVQNGVRVSGIIDTNRRLIQLKEPSFPGLTAFIGGDYTKFSR